ncbi:hypothetical protein OG884_18895 [Streptosporangium sp. NBC_01755]|uniref:hypothetical protein n=1 Tax=unclassified Streptosporangium TaxID=2632669 RepID=UPI002DDB222B|nr:MULTISPECIES: hypothetical protein [unclassified Streptosporangium]WSA23666.1 hypothetical protein OIE13_22255 [Streptosporangium sp. NBC_01810]WSD03877.1 hypothetical protein OG884_18895 [Streptosporangium sp. NBC_01755]
MDKFPGDLSAEIRQLRAEVDELRALLRQQSPLTSASAGWKIGNMASPPTPAGGGHLFASGGDPYWKDSGGVVHELITPPFPQGIAVANPPNFTSGSASGSDAVVINALRADAAGTKVALDLLLSSLRAAPLIAT